VYLRSWQTGQNAVSGMVIAALVSRVVVWYDHVAVDGREITIDPTSYCGVVISKSRCKTFYPEPSHVCGMAPRVALITGAGSMLQLPVTAHSENIACSCACHFTSYTPAVPDAWGILTQSSSSHHPHDVEER
jgi:hypothetical protein